MTGTYYAKLCVGAKKEHSLILMVCTSPLSYRNISDFFVQVQINNFFLSCSMQEKKTKEKDIESLVKEAPEIVQSSQDYKVKLSDPESVHQELEGSYRKFQPKKSDRLIDRIKESLTKYLSGESETTYSDQRKEYIRELSTIAKECRNALIKGGKAKKKVKDLEERVSVSLLDDKNNFLRLNDYLTKLQDAISYTESMLERENSLEDESVLKSQFNQLKERENETYTQLDQISIKISQTAVQKKQAREYVRYAETQSYRVQQTLQTAEYTIAFLEATDGLSEFIKAGSLAAKLHDLFGDSKVLAGETDELLVNALDSLSSLEFVDGGDMSLEDANNFAAQKMRKEMIGRIANAKNIIDAI